MMIGIDLGTTNSLVAYYDDTRAHVIPNRLGEHLTPSVVSVDEDGTILVGKTALARALRYPLSAASVFKRSMGTDREYELGGKKFRAEELSSFIWEAALGTSFAKNSYAVLSSSAFEYLGLSTLWFFTLS